MDNIFFVFLLNYSDTGERLLELERHSRIGSCSHNISRSPKLPVVFLYLDRNRTENDLYSFSNSAQLTLRPLGYANSWSHYNYFDL